MGSNQVIPNGFVVVNDQNSDAPPPEFSTILQPTLKYEGGFTVDHAGPTMAGVTQTTFDTYRSRKGLSKKPVDEISSQEIQEIYYQDFFKKPGLDQLPINTSSAVFDYGVHSGPSRAIRSLQKVVGAVQDGIIGPKTKKAVNDYIKKNGENALIDSVLTDREIFLQDLTNNNPSMKQYQKGFMNRVKDIRSRLIKAELDLSAFNPFGATKAYADEVPGVDPSELPEGFQISNSEPAPLPEGFDVVDSSSITKLPKGFVPARPTEISNAKPSPRNMFKEGLDNILVKVGLKMTPEQEIAKAQNIAMIARNAGIPFEEAYKNYDTLIKDPKITGFKHELTNEEFLGIAMAPAIVAGAVTAPVATAVGLLAFSGLDKLVDLKKFVPADATDSARTAVGLIDFIGKGLITHQFLKASPKVIERYTKQKLEQYNLPKTITLTREEVADIFKTGKLTTAEQKDLFTSANLTREQRLQAIKQGLEITIPAEKIVRYVDRPWFAEVKQKLGLKKAGEAFPNDPLLKAVNKETVQVTKAGQVSADMPKGFLPAPGAVPPLPEGFNVVSKPVKGEGGKSFSLTAEDRILVKDLHDLIAFSEGPQLIKDGEGNVVGRTGSGYPTFFQDKGYTKKGVLDIIDKVRESKPLTPKEQKVFEDVFNGFKNELATSEVSAGAGLGPEPTTWEEQKSQKPLTRKELEKQIETEKKVALAGIKKPVITFPDVKRYYKSYGQSGGNQIDAYYYDKSKYTASVGTTGEPTFDKFYLGKNGEIKTKLDYSNPEEMKPFLYSSPEEATQALKKIVGSEQIHHGVSIPAGFKTSEPPYIPPGVKPPKTPAGVEASKGIEKMKSIEGTSKPGAKPIEGVQSSSKAPEGEFKLFEKSKELVKKYGDRIGEKYTQGNLGIYYPSTGTIRVNALNNVSTVSHEVAHFVDDEVGATRELTTPVGYAKNGNPLYSRATLPIRKELTQIYLDFYPGAKQEHKLRLRMREGFAVLIQNYIAEPQEIAKAYPNIVREFLTSGGKYFHQTTGEFIRDARKIVEEYRALDPLQKIGARMTTDPQTTDKGSFLNLSEKIYTELSDQLYPFEKLAKDVGAGMTKNDPSLWLRVFQNSSYVIINNINGNKGFWALKNGDFQKVGERNWKDLINILHKNHQIEDFGKYLIARDQYFAFQELDKLEKSAQGAKETLNAMKEGESILGTSKEELLDTIRKYTDFVRVLQNNNIPRDLVEKAYLDNKNRFVEAEKLFDELERHNLNILVDPEVGLITQKKYGELADKKGYAPLKRDLYDEILGDEVGPALPIKVGGTKVSSQIGRKGSERTIINPVYSAIKDHAEVMRKALKQVVYNKIGKLGDKYPDLFMQTKLVRARDPKTGVITYPQEKDPNIIMARVGDKRVPYVVDKELKGIMDEILTFQNINLLENLLNQFSRFFTKGTTALYLPFTGINFVRDQITASALTRNKLIPILDPIKDMLKGVMKENSPEARYMAEYFIMGGDRHTFVGWQDLNPSDLFRKISGERTAIEKIVEGAVSIEDIIAKPAQVSEIMTRLAEYIKARQAGKPQIVALEEAGRVSVPFHHIGRLGGGRFTKSYVRSIPYFNPAIQAVSQFGTTVKDPKYRKRALFVTLMVVASMVAGMQLIMSRATQKQKDLYKDLPPSMLALYIFFPSLDGQKLHRIPIPQEMGPVGAIINMAFLQMMKKAKYSAGDYIEAGTQFIPTQFNFSDMQRQIISLIPQLLRPAIELSLNKKTFPNVRPLIPEGLANREVQFQVSKNTSAFAKWLGQKLNLSPIKVDHLLEGYLGRSVKFLTGKEISNPFVQEYYFTAGQSLLEYYKAKEKNQAEYNSLLNRRREMTAEEKKKIIINKARIKVIDAVLESYRKIEDKKIIGRENLTPEDEKTLDEKRTKILDLIETLQ